MKRKPKLTKRAIQMRVNRAVIEIIECADEEVYERVFDEFSDEDGTEICKAIQRECRKITDRYAKKGMSVPE